GALAAARLLLRRAAEAGSAEGALMLGTTFDPGELQRLGAIGARPDLAKARQWYQRAAELGSSAASRQLAGLADGRLSSDVCRSEGWHVGGVGASLPVLDCVSCGRGKNCAERPP